MLVRYNVTESLSKQHDYSSTQALYRALVVNITVASTGSNSTLAEALRVAGGVFQYAGTTNTPPVLSQPSQVYLHSPAPTARPTPSPTTSPTASPTCFGGYVGSSCSPCPAGKYSTPGAFSCVECPWPTTSIHPGASQCSGTNLHLGEFQIGALIVVIFLLYLLGIYYVDSHKRMFAALTLGFPVVDFITDFIYAFTTDFINERILVGALFFLAFWSLVFAYQLIDKRAWYKPLPFALKFIWLGNRGFRPTIRGNQISALAIDHFDDIPKLILFVFVWATCIIGQLVCFIPFCILAVVPSVILFLVGALLQTLKVLSVGKFWNIWFRLWTSSDQFDTDIDLDTGVLNRALFAHLLETIPQLTIQVYNSQQIGKFSTLTQVSIILSSIIACNGIYRIIYWRFIMGYRFDDVPIGYASYLIEAKKRKDTMTIELGGDSLASNPMTVEEKYVTAHQLITSSISKFSNLNQLHEASR